MGFRVPQTRELDPQVPLVQQQTMINPYFNQMMARDEGSLNRQLQLMQKKGEYDAAKEAANIERSGAWTKGLDAFTRSALPAAQSVHGMRIANRQATEQEKSGEVNRLNTMENALSTRQGREMDAAFAPREREAGLGLTQANTKMIGTQTTGMETANKSANINLQKQELQQAFEQADAAKYGFEGARDGESVAQYTMRMDAEGKVADVQRVKAESQKMQMETEQMPEELRLRRLNTLASIRSMEAQASNAYTMSRIAQEDSKRRAETHNLDQQVQKQTIVENEVDQVMKGISAGTFGNLTPEESSQILSQKIGDLSKRYGVSVDQDAAIARAFSKNSADAKAAQAAEIATANLHPSRRAMIEKNTAQTRLAMTGTELLSNLTAKINQYDQAGRFWNSDKSKLAAKEIQATLDSAAAQEPRFQPYANEFRKINAGVWAGGIEGAQNLFGASPQEQTKALVQSISNTLVTELEASPIADPITAQALQMATQNLKNNANVFYQMMFQQQPQQPVQQAPQVQPQRPFYPPVQTRSPVNQPKTMQELDQMFPPQARR